MVGPFAGDRLAVELTAQPYGEVTDVDHLLDFAARLGRDLAGLPGDERRKSFLLLPKFIADDAHQFAAGGGRRIAPSRKLPSRFIDLRR